MSKALFLLLTLLCPLGFSQASLLNEPYQEYLEGERSTDPLAKKGHFNASLRLYLALEEKYVSEKLYYNIANCYFQLHSYPEAILYYHKALKLKPHFSKGAAQLNLALAKAGLKPNYLPPALFLSKAYLQAFLIISLLTFFLISWALWSENKILKALRSLSLFLFCSLLTLTLTLSYLTPLQGILLKPSSLYQDPGAQYPKVLKAPLPAGLKVKVTEITQNSLGEEWAKVSTPESFSGFVPAQALGLI